MDGRNKLVSTTTLAKTLEISVSDLFSHLLSLNWIERINDSWNLTEIGKQKGGSVKSDSIRGTWIVWPETIKNEPEISDLLKSSEGKFLNVTSLSQLLSISRNRINPILSELGWIERDRKGWILTNLGKRLGGKQLEYDKTGIPYVCWPEIIIDNKNLRETLDVIKGNHINDEKSDTASGNSFRDKFEAKHRTADGHYVRSKAEMLIDNWLYMSEIVHAYERKLPIEEDVYCDFYLPVGKVYIEYWGLENDDKYLQRKVLKQEIYQKYGFHLIELTDSDIQNLDDILPKKLLKFGIQTY